MTAKTPRRAVGAPALCLSGLALRPRMFDQILRLMSPADRLALGLFLVGWSGYGHFADRSARSERGLRGVASRMQLDWARLIGTRESRITDAALTGDEFNRGIRACQFGLAALVRFVSPGVVIAVASLIHATLHRRDFRPGTIGVIAR